MALKHRLEENAQAQPPSSNIAAPVSIGKLEPRDFEVWLTGLGTVTPLYTVTIKSRVDGEIMSVHFKEGQMVNKGDLLIEIDPRPYQVQLEQAQGQLAHDQAFLKNATLDLSRYKTLIKKGAIPDQQLATQDALVQQYKATLISDQSQVDNAKLQLIYARITAPVTGRVGLRLVDPGNIIHATDTTGMLILTQLNPITVIFPLPQDDLPDIMAGQKADPNLIVEAWNRSNTKLISKGTLMTLDNQVDLTTGMVKLRALFNNTDNALFPNQFVNARLRVKVLAQANTIPTTAIQHGEQNTFVYAIVNKTVHTHSIEILTQNDQYAVIKSDLPNGSIVVTDGADNLKNGDTVTFTDKSPH
ncbi:MAG: MdtA/MuxA family multidrug efflux RND transporter periplasmic adaptor subunit [Ferrovum sp.]|nr:MdtA/MuxA family multidrug efflux RND transporter periplasmic adaptor subunit [Ferrovum sp.]